MKVDYIRIKTIGAGQYRVFVERYNYSPKTRHITSSTTWSVDITDSMTVDDYWSKDDKRHKRGKNHLVWLAKTRGTKEIVKFGY